MAYYWWLLYGLVLLVVEAGLGVGFFLWCGLACIVVAFAAFVGLTAWQWQAAVLAVSTIFSALSLRWWTRRHPKQTDQPFLNKRGAELVGHIYPLEAAIEGGLGFIYVHQHRWTVQGPELPTGHPVKIVRQEGAVFGVEPVDTLPD